MLTSKKLHQQVFFPTRFSAHRGALKTSFLIAEKKKYMWIFYETRKKKEKEMRRKKNWKIIRNFVDCFLSRLLNLQCWSESIGLLHNSLKWSQMAHRILSARRSGWIAACTSDASLSLSFVRSFICSFTWLVKAFGARWMENAIFYFI